MTCRSDRATNCPNCGAPLDGRGACPYCGTRRQREPSSGIEITATSIRFWSGGQLVDDGEDDAEADK